MAYNIKLVNKYINNARVQSHFRPFEEDFINYVYMYNLRYNKITKSTIFENKFYLKPKILLIYGKLNLPDDCINHINDYCKERDLKKKNWQFLNRISCRQTAIWYTTGYLYEKEKNGNFGREKFLHPNRNFIKHIKKLKDSLKWYKKYIKNI